ncbi:hypothetical protein ACFWJT_17275 [Streptomyces sp. NPDC127069]
MLHESPSGGAGCAGWSGATGQAVGAVKKGALKGVSMFGSQVVWMDGELA